MLLPVNILNMVVWCEVHNYVQYGRSMSRTNEIRFLNAYDVPTGTCLDRRPFSTHTMFLSERKPSANTYLWFNSIAVLGYFFQLCGRRSLILLIGCVGMMRRTSLSQVVGSTLCILQVPRRLYNIPLLFAASCEPAKR